MIGRLRGTLVEKGPEEVIVDVGGVGYSLHCPLSALEALPPRGEIATVIIHTHVREDALVLFGFATEGERGLFRLLISISGVGPKLALACLSGLDQARVTRAIIEKDARTLSSVPGIGKRTAERIILELAEKVQRLTPSGGQAPTTKTPHLDDLESALRNLGYKPRQVDALIAGLAEEGAELSFEALLREALRRLNS